MSQPREAIALLYDGGPEAPRITAKGEGELAEQIVQLARSTKCPSTERRSGEHAHAHGAG